jgi:hypothetical protein
MVAPFTTGLRVCLSVCHQKMNDPDTVANKEVINDFFMKKTLKEKS